VADSNGSVATGETMGARSIVQRLRSHDWMSVVIEVVIVVAGVFIALQVSNWNEARKEAIRGQEYLLRLRDELRIDAQMIERMMGFRAAVNVEGQRAMAHADTGALFEESSWKTLLAYYQASQIWPYRKPSVTFEELRSGGDLTLIQDAPLRARIAGHYSDNAGSGIAEVLQHIPAYRETIRGLVPWPVQQYIWANCYRTEAQTQVMVDCEAPLAEPEAAEILARLHRTDGLLPQLRFWLSTNLLAGVLLEQIRIEADAIADDIDARRRD
jgi:hypothetical protein